MVLGGEDFFGPPVTAELDVGPSAPCARDGNPRARRWQGFADGYALCWSPEDGVWTIEPWSRGNTPSRQRVPPEKPAEPEPPAKPEPKRFWWNIGCWCNGRKADFSQILVNSEAQAHVCIDESDKYADPTTKIGTHCTFACNRFFPQVPLSDAQSCGVITKTDRPCELVGSVQKFYLGSAPGCPATGGGVVTLGGDPPKK